MRKDLTIKLESSFLSCEKDLEIILRRLFAQYPEHAEILKRLIIIGTKDCLDMNNKKYTEIVNRYTIKDMINEGYIVLGPDIKIYEHEKVKSYIMIMFDNFKPNETNPQFRDCSVVFNIFSAKDYWILDNYAVRPIKIMGYIDGLLNNSKLTGIGTLQFGGASELLSASDFSGYGLIYEAIHGSDDRIPNEE